MEKILKILILGLLIPVLTFFIGMKFENIRSAPNVSSVNYTSVKSSPELSETESMQVVPKPSVAPKNSDISVDKLFSQVGTSDFAAMATEAATASGSAHDALLQVLIGQWSEIDPEAAVGFSADLNRNDLLSISLCALAKEDSGKALSWVESYTAEPGLENHLKRAVYRGIAQRDPRAALTQVQEIPQGFGRDEALAVVVEEWGKVDVKSVFQWLADESISPQVDQLYRGALHQYLEASPQQAATLITDMEPCELKTSFCSIAGRKLATENVTDALYWALSQDKAAQENALLGIMDVWASGAGAEEALNYVLENSEYGNHDELLQSTVMNISYRDPDLLIQAMDGMKETDQMITAERLAIALSATDSEGCDAWLSSLPMGSVRDVAIKNSVLSFGASQIARAYDFAETMSDEVDRLKVMEGVLSNWMALDGVAAENALASSSALTEESKLYLFQRVSGVAQPNDYLLPQSP